MPVYRANLKYKGPNGADSRVKLEFTTETREEAKGLVGQYIAGNSMTLIEESELVEVTPGQILREQIEAALKSGVSFAELEDLVYSIHSKLENSDAEEADPNIDAPTPSSEIATDFVNSFFESVYGLPISLVAARLGIMVANLIDGIRENNDFKYPQEQEDDEF